MGKKGRPSKYTEQLADDIRGYIRDGLSQEDAACLAGISSSTFYQWLKDKPEFSETLKKAWIENKHRHIKVIEAAEKNWQASAWWLERRFQDEFALQKDRGAIDDDVIEATEFVDG